MPSLNQTTLSAAITVSQTTFAVASATNISAPTNNFYQKIYVIDPGQTRGELMSVLAVSGTQITVSRLDEYKAGHAANAIVLIANVDPTIPGFYDHDPDGAPASTPYFTTPWVNVTNGNQWLAAASGNIWVPGWNNPLPATSPTAVQTMPAGVATPGSRFFHTDTGTSATTGFARPVGCAGGSFTIIPGGAFTWTTGDGSIGVGGTAVVAKALTFTLDAVTGVWYPSYIA